ncbi:hypothetical protein A3A46_04385 [Candidatus Roizmanbacteria bacterium RIFCSPLOWO2_01_FULL_37_13]|uniref:Lactamase n=1 Tax=Candidatus Roizmanbacteria bacterium RIFCSPHIGHO2_02_FULL_38_11 TaxID=1802039 RepID=A0A1F7GXG3_9BACT|nr:MAG: hypothetical protein A3C25_05595 [Candidatus Roizmanbacteria bacterium RIFCSPHIGHO2_02_FULL_38_11]OGK34567.1 MAG: hypothetical protein A3F58_01745 [Candidatus Roizmanbacteria bacterium RIFCSPHIGHO2_12_FULL_37_9b]OGK43014.1 MAG: hypothetical protein A3A46_04385 [Candidatus Roizmanbacteria bacterium RIFCSPLOWO2_01_FULL_37_13]
MDIKYLGHASFFIKSKEAKLVTDPFDPQMVGLKFPKIEADIVTVSHHHKDHDQAQLVSESPLVIDSPGEYEKKGLRVFGYKTYHDKKKGLERGENTVYKIEAEGVSILHCGDLGLVWDDAFIDTLGEVDVLLVPVGGFYTIDASEAVELVKKIEPSIVIPMHYNQPKLNQQNFGKLLPVAEFLKKIGAENSSPIPKLTVKKEELLEEMKVVVMEITN